jgi:hypothetical protein
MSTKKEISNKTDNKFNLFNKLENKNEYINEDTLENKIEPSNNSKQEKPKRKPNHFLIYNKSENKLQELKYLSQKDLSEGWRQVMPKMNNKKLLNNFSITLCFLPDYLWSSLYKLKNKDGDYIINDGSRTRYTIIETNQDDIMINLFNELNKVLPNNDTLLSYINELDESQHNSWLVLRAKTFIKHGYFCKPHYVTRETLGL